MKKIILFLLILSVNVCQPQSVDSLQKVLKSVTSDTARLRIYLEIPEIAYLENDMETVNRYAKLALELAEQKLKGSLSEELKKFYLEKKALAINDIASYLYYKGEIMLSFDYFKNAIKIYEEINAKDLLSGSLNNLAIIYEDCGDVSRAIECYEKAIPVLEKSTNKKTLAATLNNAGYLYENTSNLLKAIEYYSRSLKEYEAIGDKSKIAELQNDIGKIYFKSGDMIKSKEFISKAIVSAELINDKKAIAIGKNKIADIYQNQRNFSEATIYYNVSLKLLEELQDTMGQATLLRNYAGLFILQNNLKKAEVLAIRALALAKTTGIFKSIRDEAEMLCKIYNTRNNPEKAAEVCALFTTMNDSIKNIEARKSAGFIKFNEEYEKHEAELKALENQKNKPTSNLEKGNSVFVIVGGLVILALFIFFFLYRMKNRN